MAVGTISPIRAAYVEGNGDIPSGSGLEASNQTYKGGAPLVASSGNLAEAGDDAATGTVVGFAEQDGANNTKNPTIRFIPCNDGVVFEGNLCSTTAGDPDTSTTLAQTQVWTKVGLAKGTTSKFWYLDNGDAEDEALIIGLRDAVGTTNGRVYFKYIRAQHIQNS